MRHRFKGEDFDSILFNRIKKEKMLSREEEFELLKETKSEDKLVADKAKEQLLVSHLRLAMKEAIAYCRSQNLLITPADLFQEASMGIMNAIEKFDPEAHEVRLATYSRWWIRYNLQNYVYSNRFPVSMASSYNNKLVVAKYLGIKAKLEKENPELSKDDIAKYIADSTGANFEIVKCIQNLMENTAIELDKTISYHTSESDSSDRTFNLVDDSLLADELVEMEIDGTKLKNLISVAMEKLDDRESLIIKKRILTDDPITLQALAEVFNVSRERVRQLEVKALGKLRKQFVANTEIRSLVHPN